MKGTINEDAVILSLRQKSFILDIFEVNLLSMKQESHLACSLDGVLVMDV